MFGPSTSLWCFVSTAVVCQRYKECYMKLTTHLGVRLTPPPPLRVTIYVSVFVKHVERKAESELHKILP